MPYSCTLCNQSFAVPGKLSKHLQTHAEHAEAAAAASPPAQAPQAHARVTVAGKPTAAEATELAMQLMRLSGAERASGSGADTKPKRGRRRGNSDPSAMRFVGAGAGASGLRGAAGRNRSITEAPPVVRQAGGEVHTGRARWAGGPPPRMQPQAAPDAGDSERQIPPGAGVKAEEMDTGDISDAE